MAFTSRFENLLLGAVFSSFFEKGTTSLAITKNASNIIGGESDVVVYTFEMRLDTLEYFIL